MLPGWPELGIWLGNFAGEETGCTHTEIHRQTLLHHTLIHSRGTVGYLAKMFLTVASIFDECLCEFGWICVFVSVYPYLWLLYQRPDIYQLIVTRWRLRFVFRKTPQSSTHSFHLQSGTLDTFSFQGLHVWVYFSVLCVFLNQLCVREREGEIFYTWNILHWLIACYRPLRSELLLESISKGKM